MPIIAPKSEQDIAVLVVIIGVSVALQALAAWVALSQMGNVMGRYRLAWGCVALALALMVQRRMAPLWRLITSGETTNMADAIFGLAISLLMVVGLYGLRAVFTDLRSQANTDALTGLTNRRSIVQQAQHEIDRATRTQHPLAFLMFDIDHFKAVNDTYGHPAGDTVLCAVADTARATFRHIDSVRRIGGEEFLVVLPDSDQENATAAAERFRRAIAAKEFTLGDHRMGITMSIGVVIPDLSKDSVTIESVMQSADQALYAAKNGGRNRVVVIDLSVNA